MTAPIRRPNGKRVTEFNGPTPERLIQADGYVAIGDDQQGGKLYTFLDSVLDRTYSDLQQKAGQNEVDSLRREYAALRKLCGFWQHGTLMGSVSSVDFGREGGAVGVGRDHMAKTEFQLSARKAYHAALAVMSEWQRVAAIMVACLDHSLENTGYQLGCKSKTRAFVTARTVLRTAAETLADHWGMD